MKTSRDQRAKENFAHALEKADSAERAAHLAQAFSNGVRLRQQAEALLLLPMLSAAATILLCGCACVSPQEAAAHRMEQLKEWHPALYEYQYAEAMRARESQEAYQAYEHRKR